MGGCWHGFSFNLFFHSVGISDYFSSMNVHRVAAFDNHSTCIACGCLPSSRTVRCILLINFQNNNILYIVKMVQVSNNWLTISPKYNLQRVFNFYFFNIFSNADYYKGPM